MRPRFGKAFTLLELLVVMLVIGILIALFFPVLRKAREKGYVAACASNLRQIGFALQMYAEDHNGQYPPGQSPADDVNDDDLSPLYPGYIDDMDVFMCPAAKAGLPRDEWISTEGHLTRSRTDTEIGIDYEYRGRQEPQWDMPNWGHADRTPTTYVLAYDNDNRGEAAKAGGEQGVGNQLVDKYDNHGASGGNKLFSDGSVRWYPAAYWGYPWPDGTDVK